MSTTTIFRRWRPAARPPPPARPPAPAGRTAPRTRGRGDPRPAGRRCADACGRPRSRSALRTRDRSAAPRAPPRGRRAARPPSAPGGMNTSSPGLTPPSGETKPKPPAVVCRDPTTRSIRRACRRVPAQAQQVAGIDQRREVALERGRAPRATHEGRESAPARWRDAARFPAPRAAPRRASRPSRCQPIRVTCTSPTLVRVGPVRIRSPRASK